MTARFIYVMGGQTKNPVKIGIAVDLRKRLSQIQISNPDEVFVFGSHLVPARWAEGIEAACHKELKEHHRRGEWFNVGADEAVLVVERVATRFLKAVEGEDEPIYGDDIDRLIKERRVSEWAQSAASYYRSQMARVAGKPEITRMNVILAKAGGPGAHTLFRVAVIERTPLRLTLRRDPGALRKAEGTLVRALNALAADHVRRREKNLLDEILESAA